MCGIGFGMGIERLLMVAENANITFQAPEEPYLFICALGQEARRKSVSILAELRKNGIPCEMDHAARSTKAQMKCADKMHVKNVIVLGDQEIESGVVKLRNMANGEEKELELASLTDRIKGEYYNE